MITDMNDRLGSRFDELDLARGIPMLMLPIVHVYEEMSFTGTLTESALETGKILLYLCAFGPSIFMMICGMNIAFSSHTSSEQLKKRGLITLLLGIGLNFVRYGMLGIPLGIMLGASPALVLEYILQKSLLSDILVFAGFCFLFFAFVKKKGITPFDSVLIALVMLSLNSFSGILFADKFPMDGEPLIMKQIIGISDDSRWGSAVLTSVLGNFIWVDENYSAFPAMSWMIFPAVGYALGDFMKKLQTKGELHHFYKRLFAVSTVALISVTVVMYSYNLDFILIAASPANGYITDMFNVMLDISVGGIFLTAAYYVYGLIRSATARHAIRRISDSLTFFYMVQWIFVAWMTSFGYVLIFDPGTVGTGFVIVSSIIIMAISLLIGLKLSNRKNHKKALAAAAVTA